MRTIARINKPGHPHDGCEVIVSHAGINRHPYLDSVYGFPHRSFLQYATDVTFGRRPVAVIIFAKDRPEHLLATLDASELVVEVVSS